MSIITATTISRMMSPLRGWFGDLFENNGNHYGNNHIYNYVTPTGLVWGFV
ncbi:hypothetical protein [Flavobacterium sp. NKUCC04_CG]|uniref:hypothetical protein n=1 Tax=Flavobacterium sp. NKUCC04_CG TaxID=2842121 RepID=UPI001C5B9EB4|nr:hypothetical protein [Flavobacterium sp. NKUCC04_CG]MBW3519185.1 hypothetical protein [Flavobacterium sp. NKUCC04_CG]